MGREVQIGQGTGWTEQAQVRQDNEEGQNIREQNEGTESYMEEGITENEKKEKSVNHTKVRGK